MEDLAILGIGLTAILVAIGVSFVINAFSMWFVVKFMVGVPDATFLKCLMLVVWMTVVSILMILLLFVFAFIPFIGGILWIFLFFKALKITIESVLDIAEGGWTILIFYVLVQGLVLWLMS